MMSRNYSIRFHGFLEQNETRKNLIGFCSGNSGLWGSGFSGTQCWNQRRRFSRHLYRRYSYSRSNLQNSATKHNEMLQMKCGKSQNYKLFPFPRSWRFRWGFVWTISYHEKSKCVLTKFITPLYLLIVILISYDLVNKARHPFHEKPKFATQRRFRKTNCCHW